MQINLWQWAIPQICVYLVSQFFSICENLMLAKYTCFTVLKNVKHCVIRKMMTSFTLQLYLRNISFRYSSKNTVNLFDPALLVTLHKLLQVSSSKLSSDTENLSGDSSSLPCYYHGTQNLN